MRAEGTIQAKAQSRKPANICFGWSMKYMKGNKVCGQIRDA